MTFYETQYIPEQKVITDVIVRLEKDAPDK